jgi:hypothetical protein
MPEQILSEIRAVRVYCKYVMRSLLEMKDENDDRLLAAIAASMPITYQTGILPAFDVTYENFILWLRCLRAGKRFWWSKIPKRTPSLSVFQQLYGAIPALFWGLPLIGERNEEMIGAAKDWAKWALDHPNGKGDDSDQKLISSLLEMWHAFG